jgi:hypothetical protein
MPKPMTKHTDGKWTRSKSTAYARIKGKGKQKGVRGLQQWCFICGEAHEYHKGERNV